MMRRIAMVVGTVGLLAGCETLGLGGGKLREEVKVTSDPGLFAQTRGEGKTLRVMVKDADGVYQQDARVIVDVGAGGMLVKVTDNAGEAVFADIELKAVTSIRVEKTEKTRKAGS